MNDYKEYDKVEARDDKFTHIKDEMSVGLELFIRKMDADVEEFRQKYPEEIDEYVAHGYTDYTNATGFIDTVVQIRSGRKVPYQDRINALKSSLELVPTEQVQNKRSLYSNSMLYSSPPLSLSNNSPASKVIECIDELIRKNYHAIK